MLKDFVKTGAAVVKNVAEKIIVPPKKLRYCCQMLFILI